MESYKNVDEYITKASPEAQPKLVELRTIITELAPDAEEKISYGIVGYIQNGPIVYFGGFKNHVSLFATASKQVAETFKKELEPYKTSKGTIQFPLNEPLPTELIRKIVSMRVEENAAK